MHKIRSGYWSCSLFADKIRGTNKPLSLTIDEWKDWKTKAKLAHPYRFYLAENGLTMLQNIVEFPRDLVINILSYISNRYVTQSHCLVSDLPKGVWYDFDTRLLHAAFNELVNYVQVECATIYAHTDTAYKVPNHFWRYFRSWRSEEAGLKYLDWEATLCYDTHSWYSSAFNTEDNKPTPQATAAKEIKELYMWWVYERPTRKDEENYSEITEYEKEDTEKLIELINLRSHMWT